MDLSGANMEQQRQHESNSSQSSTSHSGSHGHSSSGKSPHCSVKYCTGTCNLAMHSAARFVFSDKEAKQKIFTLLDRKLGPLEYEANNCKALCYQIASEILATLNAGNDCNYKMVVMVTIGSSDYLYSGRSGMDMQIASKCLWNDQEDKFVEVIYKNPSLFAVVLLYAMKFS